MLKSVTLVCGAYSNVAGTTDRRAVWLWMLFAFLALVSGGSDAHAQGAKVSSPAELASAADRLRPGEWVWAPDIAPEGPVIVYVDLSRQLADIYRNGVRIGVSTVSTGKPGHETPSGVFTILQKDRNHHSSTYNNAPMPFQQRLTWDGVALHAGGLPGYPESHGCVHLPYTFASELFGITSMGGIVVVQGRAGAPARIPAAGVLVPVNIAGENVPSHLLDDHSDWNWTGAGSQGPVSLVLSTTDKRLVVMQNGQEIGRARVDFEHGEMTSGTHLASLARDPQSGHLEWDLVALPGHEGEQGHKVDATLLQHMKLPRDFVDRLKAVIKPGIHVLVTPGRINEHSTGRALTVLAATQ